MGMRGQAVLMNVRRYRASAPLSRQTVAFRSLQKCSPLDQAEESEQRAVEELEAYFEARDKESGNLQSQ